MYTPAHFGTPDLERLDWLAGHDAFGTLISTVDSAPFATHLPLLYRREGEKVTLTGHWARPNPQWKDIEGQRVLLILHGPHAYISARWYADAGQQVPTWNYAVAHLYGRVTVLREIDRLEKIVVDLATKYEQGAQAPWRYDPVTGRPQLRGIVGFDLQVDSIEIKFKLNQNHPAVNIRGAVEGLRSQGGDDRLAIAQLMEDALEKRGG